MSGNPKQAITDLSKDKLWPLYFLYGEESYKIEEFVESIQEKFTGKSGAKAGIVLEKKDGFSMASEELIEICQTQDLFSGFQNKVEKRILWVRNADKIQGLEKISTLLEKEPEYFSKTQVCLLLSADSVDQRKKFFTWAKKHGLLLEFKPIKEFDLPGWVAYMAKKLNITVTADALSFLQRNFNGSLHTVWQELQKAYLYSIADELSNTEITAQSLAAVNAMQFQHEMVELVDSIVSGKKVRSLLLTERLIKNQEDALGLVGFLTWKLKQKDTRFNPDLLPALLDTDLMLKSSGMDPKTVIEKMVVDLS